MEREGAGGGQVCGVAGVWSGILQRPREAEFQGRGGQLCLMRRSQVEEEEGLEKTIKLNELCDSFS